MGNEKQQNNLINLIFSITGKKITQEKVNLNQPLKVPAEKALKDSGSSRPLDEYEIVYEGRKLSSSDKVENFDFPEGAVIFLSLRTGQGGN
jgi:hypothetical protein